MLNVIQRNLSDGTSTRISTQDPPYRRVAIFRASDPSHDSKRATRAFMGVKHLPIRGIEEFREGINMPNLGPTKDSFVEAGCDGKQET